MKRYDLNVKDHSLSLGVRDCRGQAGAGGSLGDDVFCISPVAGKTDQVEVFALLEQTLEAAWTLTTEHGTQGSSAIADVPVHDALADGCHLTGKLVSECVTLGRERYLVGVEIGAADTAGRDFQ